MRLARDHVVSGHHGVEAVEAEPIGDVVSHPADRHRHECRRDTSLPNLGQQLACSGAPRDSELDELLEYPVGEAIDDLVLGEGHTLGLDDPRRLPKTRADQLQRLLVTPVTSEVVDELSLGGDPVGLGVDECSVHIPEDGGGVAVGHNPQS